MKNLIIGTAGHVDHGKTCLIKALTGIDADRLLEEKKKGITIDLGFAYLPMPNGEKIGIIDVPGHKEFVKNMLAGIGGVDIALLIVAADEGVMPQTKEHLGILSVLNISRGIIVLTKADKVEQEWIEMVKEDVSDCVKGTFLENAPMISVSAITGQGMDELKKIIYQMVETCTPKDIKSSLFRIPIDRVFSIDGFGTVITGTLLEGEIKIGDEVVVYPDERVTKIRNIQIHGKTVQNAYAGQRVAVNLANIKKEELNRGDVVAAKNSLCKTMMIDVKMQLLPDTSRILENGSRLHLHHGTSEVLCKAILLDTESLKAGESGYVQLRLEEETTIRQGDYVVVRFYSPLETLGGGKVLDANPPKHKRFKPEVIESLRIKEIGNEEDIIEQMIKDYSHQFVSIDFLVVQTGKEYKEFEREINSLVNKRKVVQIADQIFVHISYIEQLEKHLEATLKAYHKKYPLQFGMQKEEFRNKLLHQKDYALTDAFIQYFIRQKKIKSIGNYIALHNFEVAYTSEQKQLSNKIEEMYLKAGYAMPQIEEVYKLDKDQHICKQIIDRLAESGILVRINHQMYIHNKFYEEAIKLLKEFIQQNERITLGEFRDLLNTSRKYAVLILEFFDQEKITKKVGDSRILVVN